jgi:hypothetical protein
LALLAMGWTGFWIDSSNDFVSTLAMRPKSQRDCLKWQVKMASRENATETLRGLGVPTEFDLLSIDVDQNTYYIWEGLPSFKPRVVVIEYNPMIPAHIDWKVNYDPNRRWDTTQNFGASLKALELLGRRLGYSLIGCENAGVNAFFVRNEEVGDKFSAPYEAENHFEPHLRAVADRRLHSEGILDSG